MGVRVNKAEVLAMVAAGKGLSGNSSELQTIINRLTAFSQEKLLQGKTWQAGKNVAQENYIPLLKGIIAYGDQLEVANNKVQTAADAMPYAELDGDKIQAGINSTTQEMKSLNAQLGVARSLPLAASELLVPPILSQINIAQSVLLEFQKEQNALATFVKAVSGVYKEPETTKASIQAALNAIGKGGRLTYINGNFSVASMAALAKTLTDDYTKEEIAKLLSKLDIKGMSNNIVNKNNDTEITIYEKAVSVELMKLAGEGWSEKGLADVISYLNQEYKNYNAVGPNFLLPAPTSVYTLGQSYTDGAMLLVFQNLNNFLSNIPTFKSVTEYKSAEGLPEIDEMLNGQSWVVVTQNGQSFNPALLSFFGQDIPNLHYTAYTVRPLLTAGAPAIGGNYEYYLYDGTNKTYEAEATASFAKTDSQLLPPLYRINSQQWYDDLSPANKLAVSVMESLTPFYNAMQDAENPDKQGNVNSDIGLDTITQIAPLVAGGIGDGLKSGEEAGLIGGADQINPALKLGEEMSAVPPLTIIKNSDDVVKNGNLFKSPTNEANFWSGLGKNGAETAADFTNTNGGTTLEQLIAKNNIEMPEYDVSNLASVEAWEKASELYAEQASGKVNAIVGSNLRAGNIWETYELPALKDNPNVTEITETNPSTGKVTVIFKR